MSAPAWLRRHAGRLVLAGLAGTGLLAVWGFVEPGIALAGWLAGLLFWLGIALGAYAVLALHALTGGLWLAPLFPVLAPAVATLPVFALLALPLLLDAAAVWPWVADPAVMPRAVVVQWYLNLPGFVLRGALALAGWSVFGMLLVGGRARRPAVGAPALIFHVVAVTILGVDWILSLEPPFRSTVFGASLGVTQLLAALAWAALLEPEPQGFRGKAGDLAQLIMAAAIGAIYLGFAQFLVSWYGNLPDKADWFLKREAPPWILLQGGTVALTALSPIAALLPAVMRRSPRALAWIGAGVLAGVWMHIVWLVGPTFGPRAIGSAALGTLAMGGIWMGLAGGPFAARLGREVPHGA
ncbi:MAG: hypothetical protein EON47_00010 [Acetobacteraceae bacterium]|nr:MAG: hypothetical protein EON47_00010 [Acetobacteraceae bacterium]